MKKKIAASVFFVVGVLHIVRVFLGWSLVVNDFVIPAWFSVLAGFLVICLGVWLVRK